MILAVIVEMMSYTVLQLLGTTTLFCMSLAYPTRDLGGKNRLYSDLLAELKSQQATGGNIHAAF